MIRHLKILEFALTSLLRRRYKNATILAVYAFTIMVLATILFLTAALKFEASQVLAGAPDLVVQRTIAGRHALIPTAYAETIKKYRGVGAVVPRYWGYYYDSLTESNFTLMGKTDKLPELELLEGAADLQIGDCLIGQGVAAVRNIGIGDDLFLINSRGIGVSCAVVGMFKAAAQILTNDLVIMPSKDVGRFFGLEADQATDILVEVRNPREVANIAGKIKIALPETRPITKSEILRTYDAVFNWRSGMILAVFASALVAFCILAWDKATGISGEEKHEIGILKAIGWDTADVLELKFWEGLVISFSAFLLGVIGGYVHVFFFDAPLLTPILKGWSVLFPEFRLAAAINIYHLFVLFFLTVIPYVASTVFPSWKAAVTDPETIMRS